MWEPGKPPELPLDGNSKDLNVWIEQVTLLDGQTIAPARNGVTVIVGPNNAGKTLIINELADAIREPPSAYHHNERKLVEGVVTGVSGSKEDLLAWLLKNSSYGRRSMDGGREASFHRHNGSFSELQYNEWAGSAQPGFGFWLEHFPVGSAGHIGGARLPLGDPATEIGQVLNERPQLMVRLSSISQEVFGLPLTLDDESANHDVFVGVPDTPRPQFGEDRLAYRQSLTRMLKASDQGAGMVSWLTLVARLLVGASPIILLDEPEAFLHPPQARALGSWLGKLTDERHSQVVVATHDRNLLSGFLDGASALSVVRLTRGGAATSVSQLSTKQLKDAWSHPVLRYSDVFDGLFHTGVVVCEGHGDCMLLRAAWDFFKASQAEGSGWAGIDPMFVSSNGKSGMKAIVEALRAAHVPVVTAPDLDVLNPDSPELKQLVSAYDGDWDSIARRQKRALLQLKGSTSGRTVSQVQSDIVQAIANAGSSSSRLWTGGDKKAVQKVLPRDLTWGDELKNGIGKILGESRTELLLLLEDLETLGIIPLREGELERLGPTIPQNDKAAWILSAMTNRVYEGAETQAHVERCVGRLRTVDGS